MLLGQLQAKRGRERNATTKNQALTAECVHAYGWQEGKKEKRNPCAKGRRGDRFKYFFT